MTVSILGGLGLFLLGMVLMTDGLKALAGDALRRVLTRLVAGPLSGVFWGAAATTLVQSSTATTVMTIGFVSAGLLTFSQSVGVIFGANIGTTSTGWIVSLLGFKVSLGSIAPPIVLVGAALRLLARGRLASGGIALAGFGLLFVGISMLQDGMAGLAGRIGPADLPGSGMVERLMLVGVGIAMTVVMQSSSAAMVATLTAVEAGAVGMEQAAAMIIGQNVGTALTSAIAAIGTSASAKRTALAHVLFNALIGVGAFFCVPLFMWAVEAATGSTEGGGSVSLAAFHTAVKTAGVCVMLPMIGPFSRLIERMIPERKPRATRFLVKEAAEVGPVAQEAARRSLREVLRETAEAGKHVFETGRMTQREQTAFDQGIRSLEEIQRFIHTLGRAPQSEKELDRHALLLHASDHIGSLIGALRKPKVHKVDTGDGPLHEARLEVAALFSDITRDEDGEPSAQHAARISARVALMRKLERIAALESAAAGRLDPEQVVAYVNALRWIDRVAYHIWRATHHLQRVVGNGGRPDDRRDEDREDLDTPDEE